MSLFVEHEKRKRWSPAEGWVRVRTWRGPGDEVDAWIASSLPANYSSLEITAELDGWNTVTATYSIANYAGDPPSETGLVSRSWTLEQSVQASPQIGHPTAVRLDTLQAQWVYRIQLAVAHYRYAMEEWKRGGGTGTTPTFSHPYGNGTVMTGELGAVTGATTADYQFAKKLAENLIKDDNATFIDFSYVLRKTDVVTSWYALAAVHTNTGRFFSYAGLAANESTLAAAALIGAGSLPTLYWLKQPPTVMQVSRGQFQIQQDYMAAAVFDTEFYGAAITS